MVTYYFEEKNKYPHMIIIEYDVDYKAQGKLAKMRVEWLKNNMGPYRQNWIINLATLLNGNKYYYEHKGWTHYYNKKNLLKPAKQYAFINKEDALRFKLACT